MTTMKVQIADAVIVDHGKVLLVQQLKQSAHGLWSFPGGHVESGETAIDAVHREVHEELGVTLSRAKLFKIYPLETATGELELNTFVGNIEGDIVLKTDELMAYGWFSLQQLDEMRDELRAPVVLQQAREILIDMPSQE